MAEIITPSGLPTELTEITNGETLIEVYNPDTGQNEKTEVDTISNYIGSRLINTATVNTAANWTSNNPVPLNGEWCLESDTHMIKIGDGVTAWNSLYYYDEFLGSGTGSIHQYPTYKDRTAIRQVAFGFDNAVSQTGTYARLYSEIGDIYEAQHIDAGDSASGAGMFYPTPIPGKFARSAIPDLAINGTTLTLPSGFRDGTLFLVKSGTNQAVGTELYIRRVGASTVTYHSSEAGAIDSTGAITVTGIGILTQEGVALEDMLQGHWHELYGNVDVSPGGGTQDSVDAAVGELIPGAPIRGAVTDTVNGTPRTTNETRPTQFYSYWYIKF